jgi:hypothetical protein
MSLFSDKKVVYVSSVAYNMAGPVADRVSVLKSTVSRHVLLNEKKIGLGERIVDTQLNGPTMDQRAWFRWTKNHYDQGKVAGRLGVEADVDESVVEPYLPTEAGFYLVIDQAKVLSADIEIWAQQHIMLTTPSDLNTAWVVDYVSSTNSMVITYEDLSTETVVATGYVRNANYIVCYYRKVADGDDPEDGMPRIFLYRVGSGNSVLDVLYVGGTDEETFFPFIPLRINNKPIDHADFADDYDTISRAYKKVMGESISTILGEIEDNPNVDDIDFASVMFGVEITTQEKCGLRYLYEFFKTLADTQSYSPASFKTWCGGSLPHETGTTFDLTFRAEPPNSELRITGDNAFIDHDIRINWVTIDETLYSGVGKVGAKKGDLWFVDRPAINVQSGVVPGDTSIFNYFKNPYEIPHSRLFWQTDSNTYKVLDLYGMVHRNYVYRAQAVYLSTSDALSGDDEEGFIVPLHYPTLRKLPLIQANQLALSNRHVVFNCYKVVKVRWYERGIFKILLSILISIAISFIFPGASGLFGTALNVGTSAGLSGVTAIILGATLNALGAIGLMMSIEGLSTGIFGEELGAVVAAIFSFLAFQAFANFTAGMGFTIDWGSMMRIDNLMTLMNTAVDTVSKWLNAEIGQIQIALGEAGEKYKDDLEELNKKALELLGAGGGAIDPLMFTQAQSRFYPAESRDAFLKRTLMTGSDLIDLSIAMIEDFADLNLMLENKIA